MSSLFLLFVGSAGFTSMNLNMLFFVVVVVFFWGGVSEEFIVEHGTLTTTLVNFHDCIFFPNLLRWIVLPRAWWFFLLFFGLITNSLHIHEVLNFCTKSVWVYLGWVIIICWIRHYFLLMAFELPLHWE